MTLIVVILAVLVLGLGLWLMGLYNGLVRRRNLVREAWSGVDVQLKRRADLIPNLIETVKGYAAHERGLFQQIADLRSRSLAAKAPAERSLVEGMLSGALGNLFALAEAYPELKASANFSELQGSLAQVEEQIQLARRYYNGAVRDLNIAVESFPANLVAGPLGFTQAEFFELEQPADRALPKVDFS